VWSEIGELMRKVAFWGIVDIYVCAYGKKDDELLLFIFL